MKTRTVDVGIDLGTTNSVAAVMVDGEPQIVTNDFSDALTPSCVAVNERGELEVGQPAIKVLRTTPANAAEGFKRFIGNDRVWTFPSNGASYSPEQLSSLVLQSLRRNLEAFLNEEVDAAVITIPAVFGEKERSATLSAAREAGFTHAELVQEPIAAGLAYGWSRGDDESPFLVYDIGGGTFDAAIVQVVNGQLIVRAHRGDHALGGREIDEAILDKVVRPQLVGRIDAGEIDQKKRELLGRLEDAKKRLSQTSLIKVPLEGSLRDSTGKPLDDVLTISRDDIEPLVDAVVLRTVRVVEELFAETSLQVADLRGIVLVGGPTRTPRLRALLQEHFGDILETRVDPLTVVARGAALHAASQIRRQEATTPKQGMQRIRIEYPPVSDQMTASVGLAGLGQPLPDGSTIRITRTDGLWQTGLIPVSNGRVITQVSLGEERQSHFRVELFDSSGAAISIEPDGFAIVSGLAAAPPPLSHNIGISIATPTGPRFHQFARRGDPLPFSKRESFRTTKGVRAGDTEVALEVYFLEGDSDKPQRCHTLGVVKLTGDMIDKALPPNSDVDITLRLGSSDTARATIDVPLLGRTIEGVFEMARPDVPTPSELRQNLDNEVQLANRLGTLGADIPQQVESIVQEVEADLKKAEAGDPEAAKRAGHALDRVGAILEDTERKEEHKLAIADLDDVEDWAKRVVSAYGESEQQARLAELQARARSARDSKDARVARQVGEDMLELAQGVYWSQPGAWIAKFQSLASESTFLDARAAASLMEEGRRALEAGDSEMLRRVVIELWNLSEDRDQESPEARLMWLRPV